MLKAFRNASNSWFIKILFSAIILSFCLWGIGDIIRNYSASQPVVKIGKTSVTSEYFARQYHQIKQDMGNSQNGALTSKELDAIDIKGIVLEKLINENLIREMISKYGVVISNEIVKRVLESIPEFHTNGIFDPRLYATFLQRSGMSDAAFINDIREGMLIGQFMNPITLGYRIPLFIKDLIAKEFETKKTLTIGKIVLNDITTETVDEDDAIEYYNSNKQKYKKPESRDVKILVVDTSAVASGIQVTDEEIAEYYKNNKEQFTPRESRNFSRFIFSDREHADKAWELMKKGEKTPVIVKEFLPKVDELNDMEKEEFPKQIRGELFSIEKLEDISSVYEIGGKFYIYRLTAKHSEEKNKIDIDNEIKEVIKNEKLNSPEVQQHMKELKDKVDDGFGEGKSIETISTETGMKILNVNNIKDKDTLTIEGVTLDQATEEELRGAAFNTEEKQASPIVNSHDSDTLSFVVFVESVRKESIPEIAEVKQLVVDDCLKGRRDEVAKEKVFEITGLGDKAIEQVKKLKKVKSYVISKKDIVMDPNKDSAKVAAIAEVIPNLNVVMDIMSTLKKGEAKYFVLPDGNYIVVAIQNVEKVNDVDVKFAETIGTYIDNQAKNDMSSVAIKAFKTQVSVEIKEELIEKITKPTDDETRDS